MEYWDLYTKAGQKSAIVIPKGQKIPHGLFHIVVETLIKHEDGTYLVMKRDYNKVEFPGLYEGSAGGSLISGETKEEGAIREVKEETGLIITEVFPTYYFVNDETRAINQGYIAYIKGKKDIVYLKGETIDHKWLSLPELKEFIKSKDYNPKHSQRLATYLETLNN
ncbi:MAG: NUDIX hydrolase [Bacilli bacterium]|nr:NUDIX hydrolase [Bacilli bacterium]